MTRATEDASLQQTIRIAKSSRIWLELTCKSLKSVSQTMLEFSTNLSASFSKNWNTVKSVHDVYHAVEGCNFLKTNSFHCILGFSSSLCDRISEYLELVAKTISSHYVEALKHLRRQICCVRDSLESIISQHDNAWHTLRAREKPMRKLKFEPIPRPPYSPDFAPCDFHSIVSTQYRVFIMPGAIKS